MLAENKDIFYFCLFFSTVQKVLECKLKQQFHKIDAYMKEKKNPRPSTFHVKRGHYFKILAKTRVEWNN